MTLFHYTAEVKEGLLLELPVEAEALHLAPGDKVRVQLIPAFEKKAQERKTPESAGIPRRVSAMGKYAGVISSEDFLRRKHEETLLEDRPIR